MVNLKKYKKVYFNSFIYEFYIFLIFSLIVVSIVNGCSVFSDLSILIRQYLIVGLIIFATIVIFFNKAKFVVNIPDKNYSFVFSRFLLGISFLLAFLLSIILYIILSNFTNICSI